MSAQIFRLLFILEKKFSGVFLPALLRVFCRISYTLLYNENRQIRFSHYWCYNSGLVFSRNWKSGKWHTSGFNCEYWNFADFLFLWVETQSTRYKNGAKKLETTYRGTNNYFFGFSLDCSCLLSFYKNRKRTNDLAGIFIFGSATVNCFFVGSDGFNCKRKYSGGHF